MSNMKLFALGIVAAMGLGLTGEASADSGSSGGYSYDGHVYSRDITRYGPSGGSYSRSTTCNKAAGSCSASSTYTGPAGYSASRSATRSRSGGTVSRSASGPYGRSVTRTRTWRR